MRQGGWRSRAVSPELTRASRNHTLGSPCSEGVAGGCSVTGANVIKGLEQARTKVGLLGGKKFHCHCELQCPDSQDQKLCLRSSSLENKKQFLLEVGEKPPNLKESRVNCCAFHHLVQTIGTLVSNPNTKNL